MPPPMEALLLIGVVMCHRHLLIVSAFGAGEVPGAAGRVGGDDGGLVVIIDVATLLALLAVGDHSAPLVHDDPTRNLYRQRATSVRDVPARRLDSTGDPTGDRRGSLPPRPALSGGRSGAGGRPRPCRSRIRGPG